MAVVQERAKVDVLSSVDEQRLHARFALRAAGLLQHGSLCATAGCSELRDLGRLGESCGLLLMRDGGHIVQPTWAGRGHDATSLWWRIQREAAGMPAGDGWEVVSSTRATTALGGV